MEQDLRKKLYNEVKKRGLMKEQDAIEMETNDKGFEVMISKLNTSSIQVHIYHWQVKGTGSYAAHKAFQKYYEGIVDLTDGLVEAYQGKYGIIEHFTCEGVNQFVDIQTSVDYFVELLDMIEENRKSVEDSYLQNEIDTIVKLINATLYKLRFLH
jgi:DNA-binding ferritin-like protein